MVATMINRPSLEGKEPGQRGGGGGRGWLVPVLVGLALVVVLAGASLVPSIGNPFASDTIDRSQPALLRALEDLSEYRASSANFELVLDVEEDARHLPSFLKGERTIFVAAGSVDAYVDFRDIGPEGVDVSSDRRRVTITLPRAQLAEPRVDIGRSYVAVRDRGLLDRLGSVLSDNPTGEREFYLLAEKKLQRAAQESAVVEAAERNTEKMLEALARSLGFTEVAVKFQGTPGER